MNVTQKVAIKIGKLVEGSAEGKYAITVLGMVIGVAIVAMVYINSGAA